MPNWLKSYSPKQIKEACQEFAHFLGHAYFDYPVHNVVCILLPIFFSKFLHFGSHHFVFIDSGEPDLRGAHSYVPHPFVRVPFIQYIIRHLILCQPIALLFCSVIEYRCAIYINPAISF